MENFGLITYREARVLYDKETSSTADKEGVVQVIAHEFAHMWFGNLGEYIFLFSITDDKVYRKKINRTFILLIIIV